jgi:hypothetical protein
MRDSASVGRPAEDSSQRSRVSDPLRLGLPSMGIVLNPQLLVAAPYLLALLVMVVARPV